jgi:hypothetical protein
MGCFYIVAFEKTLPSLKIWQAGPSIMTSGQARSEEIAFRQFQGEDGVKRNVPPLASDQNCNHLFINKSPPFP